VNRIIYKIYAALLMHRLGNKISWNASAVQYMESTNKITSRTLDISATSVLEK